MEQFLMHSFNTSAERNKVLTIQLLDKCLGGNKIEALWYTCLTLQYLVLVPKGCNIIAPLALVQQFLIALFF